MKKKHIFFVTLPQVTSLVFSGYLFATPVIDSVTTGASGDNTLVISGSGFGEKSTGAPRYHEDFESGDSSERVVKSSYATWGSEITTTGNRQGSNYAMIADNYSGIVVFEDIQAGSEVFISSWFYLPADFEFTSGSEQIKIMRTTNGDTSGVPNAYLNIRDAPYTNFFINNEKGSTIGNNKRADAEGGAAKIVRGAWNRIDWYAKLSSSIDAADGIHRLWVNGEKLIDVDEVVTLQSTQTSITDLRHTKIILPDTHRVAEKDFRAVYDDIYIDRTLAHVEISDQATWDDTTTSHKEIQIPISWNDSSIEVTSTPGSFDSDDSLYLYVIDKDGNVNADGYSLSASAQPGNTVSPLLLYQPWLKNKNNK